MVLLIAFDWLIDWLIGCFLWKETFLEIPEGGIWQCWSHVLEWSDQKLFGCKYKIISCHFPPFYCITDNLSIHRSVYKLWSSKACSLKTKYHEGLFGVCVSAFGWCLCCVWLICSSAHMPAWWVPVRRRILHPRHKAVQQNTRLPRQKRRGWLCQWYVLACVCVCVCVLLCTNLLCCLFSRVKCIPEIKLVPPFNATPFKV